MRLLKLPQAWGFLALILVPAALLFSCLVGYEVLGGFDYLLIWYPLAEFANAAYEKHGVLPFWLPQILGGMPFGESLVPSLHYPTDISAWWLGIKGPAAYAWGAYVHLVLGGIGMMVLARSIGISSAAATIAGLTYVLGAYPTNEIVFGRVVFLRGAAWLPWVLWSLRGAVSMPSVGRWTVVGVFLAMLPLGASYQQFYYALFIGVVVAVSTGSPRQRVVNIGWTGAAFSLAGLLAAVNIIPGIRYFFHSARSGFEVYRQDPGVLRVDDMVSMVIPGLWGVEDDFFGPHVYTVYYLGLVCLGLAVLACISRWRLSRLWFAGGVVAAVLAMGEHAIVRQLAGLIPIWESFRFSVHWLVVLATSVSILAAIGLEAVLVDGKKGLRILAGVWILAALALAIVLLLHGGIWEHVSHRPWVEQALEKTPSRELLMVSILRGAILRSTVLSAVLATCAALMSVMSIPRVAVVSVFMVAASVDLAWETQRDRTKVSAADYQESRRSWSEGPGAKLFFPEMGKSRAFMEGGDVVMNSSIPVGYEWMGGYHGAPLAGIGNLYSAMRDDHSKIALLSWLGVRRMFLSGVKDLGGLTPISSFKGSDGKQWTVYDNAKYAPRVFFARRAGTTSEGENVFERLADMEPSAGEVLVNAPHLRSRLGSLAGGKVFSYVHTPNLVKAKVRARGPGLVVFNEIHYPAWTALVDGERTPVDRVNGLMRGVFVETGAHEIVMVYNSVVMKIGLLLSVSAWSAVVVILAVFIWRKQPEFPSGA